jgi:hypothetical protein
MGPEGIGSNTDQENGRDRRDSPAPQGSATPKYRLDPRRPREGDKTDEHDEANRKECKQQDHAIGPGQVISP